MTIALEPLETGPAVRTPASSTGTHASGRGPCSPSALLRLHGLLLWGRSPAAGWVRPVDVLWTIFTVGMLAVMWVVPDQQTVPYHLIFVSFTLVYGYRLWSPAATIAVLSLVTAVTGAMFIRVYAMGHVTIDEVAEIPLMTMIIGAMAWHAQRSATAQRRVQELAARDASQADRQRAFLRDTAHAIRTPVTIARGTIELMQLEWPTAHSRVDTDEVLHQLDRLHHMARRLLAIEALQSSDMFAAEPIDVGQLTAAAGRRWSGVASRDWVIETQTSARTIVDRLRMEESVDALVENALRFTKPGGRIRLTCRVESGTVLVEVADDGPGIAPPDRERVFERFFHRQPVGEEPGTGLGLALVAAVAEAFGGSVSAGPAPEGGASVGLRLPRLPPG